MYSTSSGLKAEDRIQLFAERSFFSDFVFRTPRYMRGPLEREAGDVLIWFDGTLIIVQSKARNLMSNELCLPFSHRERSWAEKNLSKAVRQLRGCKRALLGGRVTTLVNKRRGEIPFAPNDVQNVFGIVIMDQMVDYYDPVSSVPDVADKDIPVHVFALSEWPLLCSELSTTPDFISYLRFRNRLLESTPMLVGKEADPLALFIIKERDPDAPLQEPLQIDRLGIRFGENFKAERAARDAENRYSLVIDDLINRLHDQEPSLAGVSGLSAPGPGDYIASAVELSKLNRVKRRVIGRKLVERIRLAKRDNCARHYVVHARDDVGFFLMASPEPRPVRARYLIALTALAKHHCKLHTIVGIATEAGFGKGRSYDTCYLTYPWRPDPRADELAAAQFAEPTSQHETEFPDLAPRAPVFLPTS